jgi:superoxide dismutase, Fe-Mn family
MMTRRDALKTTAIAAAACATAGSVTTALAQTAAAPAGPFSLPALPYAADALEPHIDARTMEIHHDKHHAAYVTNLNKALATHTDLGKKSVEELISQVGTLPQEIQTAVRNNGGGHFNHSLFWQMMKKGGGQPSGDLAKAIESGFSSFTGFQTKMTEAATKVFGSGWAWLLVQDGKLAIESSPNQDSPVMKGVAPGAILLGLDVWEHAYYLKYQNRRPDYIAAWFNVINWDFVAERFTKAQH